MEEYEFLIKEYTPLIYSIASKFPNFEKEELFQAGAQGLIKAFKNFDDTRNTKFSTYAYNDIYGEMYKLIYQNNDLKITRDSLQLYKKIVQISQMLTQKLKKVPTYYEIAQYCNLEPTLVESTLMSLSKSLSLDAPINDDCSYIENITQEETLTLDDKIFLEDSIENLPEPEKSIIRYRYYQDLTQSETAQVLGLSQVKVSRYEKKGIEKMRVYAKDVA